MTNDLVMRTLTAEEIDSVAAAGGGFNIIINPQINAAIIAAISIFGDSQVSHVGIANIGLNAAGNGQAELGHFNQMFVL